MTPVVASPPTPPRILDASTSLTASFEGMNQLGLAFLAGQRLADQFVQAPLTPLVLAAQLAAGDNERLFSQIRQIVDSPLYVADPLIEAIAITLPEEFGGGSDHETTTTAGDGDFMQFRNNELLGLRDAINTQFASALGVEAPWPNENYTAALAAGMQESAVRAVNGAVLGVVGLAAVAEAMASGDNVELYKAIRSYIDAPQWVIDPTIEGLAEALPESLGGGTNGDPTDPTGDGALMQFRNNQMLGARNAVRVATANVLGVEVNEDGSLPTNTSTARTQLLSATTDADADTDAPKVTKRKAPVAALDTALGGAKDRAEKRANKAKASVDRVVKKVKEAADNTAKKLSPKKAESKDSED
ncbi:hypothetical protein [Mycolicibacterium sp. HK-90]|uniref:hypothetical protein n=1 Tax=Mycolicibacterium sp. HK-90 TaxID=3056937 RepID=UPI002658184C|nr:hypothetical protein [Mycolicibacterium sp. HK-90]WKG04420.1 hypothetical protein QU592_04710 [Mycolicibacterium sp. HK-90]